MKLKANWDFSNGTLAPLVGPTLSCTRADAAQAQDFVHMDRIFSANQPRFVHGIPYANRLTNSGDLTHADWTKFNVDTPEQDGTLDPWGNQAWKLTDNGTLGVHGVGQSNITAAVREFLCREVVVKAGTARYITIAGIAASNVNTYCATFDLETGAITDGASRYLFASTGHDQISDHIQPLGDGWYAVRYTGLADETYNDFVVAINPDGVTANTQYSGSGQYLYVSKPRAYNTINIGGADLFKPNLADTGDTAGMVEYGKRVPRANMIGNSILAGYGGKGTPPYGLGSYFSSYGWREGTTTGNGEAVSIESPVEKKTKTGLSSGGDGIWDSMLSNTAKGVRCSGTNQQYFLDVEWEYQNLASIVGHPYYGDAPDFVFSIVIEDVKQVPTGPIIKLGPNTTGGTYTLPGDVEPGTRVFLTFKADNIPHYSYGADAIISIGLGADGNNDTGDFTWSSPQLEYGTKPKPYIPTDFQHSEHQPYTIDSHCDELDVALLVDQPCTNLIEYSSDISNAAWLKTNSSNFTYTSNHLSKSESYVARRFRANGPNPTEAYISQNITFTPSTVYTAVSCGSNRGTQWIRYAVEGLGTLDIQQFYTSPWVAQQLPSLGTQGADVNSSAVTKLGGGMSNDTWWHTMTFTSDAVDTTGEFRINIVDADNDVLVNGTVSQPLSVSDIAVYEGEDRYWWVPRNEGAGALTIAGDVIKTTDLSFFTESQGTFVAEFTIGKNLDNRYVLSIDDGTTNNRICITTDASGNLEFITESSNVVQSTQTTASALTALERYRAVFCFQDNEVRAYLNGAAVGSTDTSATMPTSLTEFHVGCSPVDADQLGGLFHSVQYYSEVLSAEDALSLSSTTGFNDQVQNLDSLFNISNPSHVLFCDTHGEDRTPDGYRRAMGKALDLQPSEYNRLSVQDLFRKLTE